jgi:very-short-patch-repair endonuclease
MSHFNTKSKETLTSQILKLYDDKISYLYDEYKNDRTKMKFICKEHGEFYQYPGHLLQGHGCQRCSKMSRITEDEFITQANVIHNDKYTYPIGEYKNKRTKVKIICPIHGEFYQLPKHHLNGSGCKECRESRGEKKIKQLLKQKNINFEKQKTIKGCKDKKLLQFDFFLPDRNLFIEYDGIQHFKSSKWFGGDDGFENTRRRDEIKTNFCLKNDIKLIRINYKDNIEERLQCILMPN